MSGSGLARCLSYIEYLLCSGYKNRLPQPVRIRHAILLDYEAAEVDEVYAGYIDDVIDELKRCGVEPMLCLEHYEIPAVLLEQYGGWGSKNVGGLCPHTVQTLFLHKPQISQPRVLIPIRHTVPAGQPGFRSAQDKASVLLRISSAIWICGTKMILMYGMTDTDRLWQPIFITATKKIFNI